MENIIDSTKSLDHQDQNGPRTDDKDSTQNPEITSLSVGRGPLVDGEDDTEVPPGDGTVTAAEKVEKSTGDGTVPAAERVEKNNAGGGQGASRILTRKRAREAGEEGSGGNRGGGGGGDHLVVEKPVKLFPCPGEGCGQNFESRRALFMHVSVHVKRPWRGGSSRPLVSREERKGKDKEEKGGEGGEMTLSNDAEPAADTGGAAIDEAFKVAREDIDLNMNQFLLPDLNLPPPEYCG